MASLLPSNEADRNKVVAGLFALAVLFGYWYFFHSGKSTELEASQTRLEELEGRNAAARARASRGGREMEMRLEEFERHIGQLEQLVPNEEEVPELLNAIGTRAGDTGVELAVIRPLGEQPVGLYTRQTYELTVFGTFHDIGRFLAQIGSLPRIITPIDLAVRPRGETDRSGRSRLEASFQIETYVLPPEGPAQQPQSNADD